jgi:hypothetical protein
MANLYLITSLFDEGIYESSFRVVEAESELEIAQHILAHPSPWQWFLKQYGSVKRSASILLARDIYSLEIYTRRYILARDI